MKIFCLLNARLLRRDEGEAIQGLYAVGNAAGNFFSNDYPMVCPGISHGRCLTLGYVLGEQLAK